MGVSTLVRMVLGFVSLVIVARVVPEEAYGVYFLILAIVYVLEVIGDVGLRLSAAKFIASAPNDDEQRVIVNNLLTFRLLTVLIVSFLAIVGKPLILFFFHNELLSSLYIYVPILFFIQLTEETLSYIMQGFHLYRKMAVVQALTGLLNLALVMLFILFMDLDIEGLLLAYILSLSIAALLRLWMIPTPKDLAFDAGLIRRIIRFGLPLQGNDILSFVFQKVDVLILAALMSPVHIAYLEVAAKIPDYLRRLYYTLQSVYFPHMAELFARKHHIRAEDVLNNVLRVTSFSTMLCALVSVLFQREIMVVLFSEKYLPGAPALGVLMVVVGIGVASTILDTALISAGHPAYMLIIGLVTAVASILGNVTMIPPFGFMGAAYAKLLANVVANPVSVWCLRREKIGVRVDRYLKPAFLLAICVTIYLVLGWDTVVLRGSLIILFVALSMSFSVVTGSDILVLLGSLRLSIHRLAFKKDEVT